MINISQRSNVQNKIQEAAMQIKPGIQNEIPERMQTRWISTQNGNNHKYSVKIHSVQTRPNNMKTGLVHILFCFVFEQQEKKQRGIF